MQPTENSEIPKQLSPSEREAKRNAQNKAAREKLLATNPSYFTDYSRRRREAVKAGTWAPRRKKAGQVLPDASPCSTEPPVAS